MCEHLRKLIDHYLTQNVRGRQIQRCVFSNEIIYVLNLIKTNYCNNNVYGIVCKVVRILIVFLNV